MGKSALTGQNSEKVLRYFGNGKTMARMRYLSSIEDGIADGLGENSV